MADNIAIVKGAYEALANGDINTFIDVLDEQIEWHLPEHHPLWPGKAFVGPQAVVEGHLARISQVYDVSESTFNGSLHLVTRYWPRCGVEARAR
jgi:ketosteroid isomerase-like protein